MEFGIDFGTTNSACVGLGKRKVRFTDGSGKPFPSLVAIDPVTGVTHVGRSAWDRREELSQSCIVIPSVKRYLGTDQRWKVGNSSWSPARVAGRVFAALRDKVMDRSGLPMTEAVVAVPVGWDPERRRDLRRAAETAGIGVKEFVSEPTAALFAHYQDVGMYRHIAVFDWGGGTLDVVLLENSDGHVVERASGSLLLGGDDLDLRIARWTHHEICTANRLELPFERVPASDRDRLMSQCEKAKRDLSSFNVTSIELARYASVSTPEVTLTVERLTDLLEHEVDRAVAFFESVIGSAGATTSDIDRIVMVGGSVNLRPFRSMVIDRWKGREYYPADADWSVAEGAAMLSLNPGRYTLAQSVGVIMSDGGFYPLTEKGEKVTAGPKTCSFALVEDSAWANFVFGDGEVVLGYLSVPSYGFMRESIKVETIIDGDLVLRIEAQSGQKGRNSRQVWAYPGLRLNYQLPAATEAESEEV
jgi:molecular chaperone DnaK